MPGVRRALTLTADRSALLAEAAGATAYAAEGLIPPGVPGSGEQDFRTDGGVLLDNDPAHRDELAEEAAACWRRPDTPTPGTWGSWNISTWTRGTAPPWPRRWWTPGRAPWASR